MHATSNETSSVSALPASRFAWRLVDIVVASIVGVAAGVVFWAWGIAYGPLSALLALTPGFVALLGGVWLLAGVLGALIVRKPGAAIYTELIAAAVSALLGSQWGFGALWSGFVQGLGAEIIFAIFLYANWRLFVAVLAGGGAGLFMAINDLIVWYPGVEVSFQVGYTVYGIVSGAVLAGVLPWLIVRSLARAGALSRFAAGRAA